MALFPHSTTAERKKGEARTFSGIIEADLTFLGLKGALGAMRLIEPGYEARPAAKRDQDGRGEDKANKLLLVAFVK